MQRAEMFTVSQTNWRKLCGESSAMFSGDITCGQCSTSYSLGKVHRWARPWGRTREESEKSEDSDGNRKPSEETGKSCVETCQGSAPQSPSQCAQRGRANEAQTSAKTNPHTELCSVFSLSLQANVTRAIQFERKSQEKVTSSMQLFSRSSTCLAGIIKLAKVIYSHAPKHSTSSPLRREILGKYIFAIL